jgi:antitoxin VapB
MATAKLLDGGHGQVVQLPAEFHFEGTEVNVERDPETGHVVLSPPQSKPEKDWEEFFARLKENPIEEDFLADRKDELPVPRDIF